MTRSVKDLRELICVSRLTMRESDDEDDELSRPLTSLSIFGEPSPSSRQLALDVNGLSLAPRLHSEENVAKPMSPRYTTGARRKQPRTNKHAVNINNNASVEFKKFKTPLPPLESRPCSGSSADSGDRPNSEEVVGRPGNFDNVLRHADGDAIVGLLGRANEMVDKLASWCNADDNFVAFANFVLTDFPGAQWLELLQMEVGILNYELRLVFDRGLEQGRVHLGDLDRLVSALLREYPGRLCGLRGTHVFLDVLDTLSSERAADYKALLTDVRVSTRNRDFAQSLLALRAFVLLSVWGNIVGFYRRFRSDGDPPAGGLPRPPADPASVARRRVYRAIQRGFVSVLHYLARGGKLDLTEGNQEDRSLVFEAVMHNQPRVLHYLLSKTWPPLDVNRPSESGNTPLHAAANWGHAEVVHMLLDKGQAAVNAANPKCDGATPLHLAVMQGHTAVCKLLLEAGADPEATMNGVGPARLARDMGHGDILVLLSRRREAYDDQERADRAGDQDAMVES